MKTRINAILAVITLVCLVFACKSGVPDAQLRSTIIDRLSATPGLTSVTVSVEKGVANLTGTVSSDSDRTLAESLAKIEGITSIVNQITVVPNTPEVTYDEPEDVPQSWSERAMAFLEEHFTDRVVQCEDSYFLWDKRDGLYETKTQPYFNIGMERTVPASEPSAADKLNGTTEGKPETWYATWQVRIDGPWRSYSQSKWNAWRDDGLSKGDSIEYTADEEFVLGTAHHDFLKLSEPECSDGNVNVPSLIGKGGDNDGMVTKTITVPASKDGFTDSGIVVRQGQLINIEASGTWSNGEGTYDAAGSKDFSGNAFSGGVKVGGLVAKIAERNYEWAPGPSWSGTAQGDGRLIFRMNDLYQKYGDNKGALKVTITLSP